MKNKMRAHELLRCRWHSEMPYQDQSIISNAVKFYIGHWSSLFDLTSRANGMFCKPPYPITLLQGDANDAGDASIWLVVDDGDGVEVVMCSTMSPPEWTMEPIKVRLDGYMLVDGGKLNAQKISVIDMMSGEAFGYESFMSSSRYDQAKSFVKMNLNVFALMECLSCSNIEYIDNPAPRFINEKRMKKGKAPFYTYKTLHIKIGDNENAQTVPGSGSHASPRMHLRRGHVRTLSDGRKIWVQHCIVGSKDDGIVEKDYMLSLAGT